ncbi:MAG: hypothetical protein GY874_11090 [Desulfobacteraceae bacterium]|nr:hypothetical protein [Desulfobacteraceae bacterium]
MKQIILTLTGIFIFSIISSNTIWANSINGEEDKYRKVEVTDFDDIEDTDGELMWTGKCATNLTWEGYLGHNGVCCITYRSDNGTISRDCFYSTEQTCDNEYNWHKCN